MADVDVQRLLLQVDASIDLARRQMRELSTVVENETGKWDNSLKKGDESMKRVGKSLQNVGQMRGGMQQLSFQIGDVATQMSMGTKASVIFAQQSGQVIQALQLMSTSTKGFLGFLGGPWGIVLTAAITVAASFAAKLFDTRDETDKLVAKMREQADQAAANERANKIWEASLEGVREAQKKLRDEIDASLKVEAVQERQNVERAQDRLEQQRGFLRDAERDLAAAQSARDGAAPALGQTGSASNAAAQASIVAELDKRLETARKKVAELKRDIASSEATVRSAQTRVALSNAEAASSATNAIGAFAEAVKAKFTIASQAGKIAAADLEAAKIAFDAYSAAQTKAAGEGVNFGKVGASREVTNLTKSFANGQTPLDQYVKRVQALTKALNDAAKAAADAKKAGNAGRETTQFILAADGPIKSGIGPRTAPQTGGGRTGSSNHAGLDIAVPVGTPVKAPAAGTVKVGSDPKGFGIFIRIDHGGGAQSTLGHLSGVDVKNGDFVEQGQTIARSGNTGNSSGPHLHQETRVGGKIVDPRNGPIRTDRGGRALAGTAQETRLVDKKQDQDDAFAQRMEALEQQALEAQMELVRGIDGQADFALQMVDAQRDRYLATLENDKNDGRLREEQVEELKLKADAIATQRKSNIEARRALDKAEDANRTAQQESELKLEGLRYADEIARTQEEHRRIQLEILDLMYEQREADLRLAKAKAEAAGNAEEAARIQGQINAIPDQRARDEDRVNRGTQNPIEEWADTVPQTAGEINEAFMEIDARGLDSLADGIASVISGSQSMGAAFRQVAAGMIADIARLIARMLILKAIQAITGMAGGAAGGPAPGTFDGVSFGSNLAPGAPGPMGLASGGMISLFGGKGGIDGNMLSINGRNVAKVDRTETIAVIPRSASRARIPQAPAQQPANDRGSSDPRFRDLHVHVQAANTGDPARDHASALQQGRAARREIANHADRS